MISTTKRVKEISELKEVVLTHHIWSLSIEVMNLFSKSLHLLIFNS